MATHLAIACCLCRLCLAAQVVRSRRRFLHQSPVSTAASTAASAAARLLTRDEDFILACAAAEPLDEQQILTAHDEASVGGHGEHCLCAAIAAVVTAREFATCRCVVDAQPSVKARTARVKLQSPCPRAFHCLRVRSEYVKHVVRAVADDGAEPVRRTRHSRSNATIQHTSAVRGSTERREPSATCLRARRGRVGRTKGWARTIVATVAIPIAVAIAIAVQPARPPARDDNFVLSRSTAEPLDEQQILTAHDEASVGGHGEHCLCAAIAAVVTAREFATCRCVVDAQPSVKARTARVKLQSPCPRAFHCLRVRSEYVKHVVRAVADDGAESLRGARHGRAHDTI